MADERNLELKVLRVPQEHIRRHGIEVWGITQLRLSEGLELPFMFRYFDRGQRSEPYMHAPYNPLGFVPPILTEPINAHDMSAILSMLKMDARDQGSKRVRHS